MANPEHLNWLKEGVVAWNKRRLEESFFPDLSDAILREANLRGADLRGADLQEANLLGANLQEADLEGAKLRGANLRGADLQEANLLGANLLGADLQEAKLRGANLQEANLREADLRGTDLQRAKLRGAKLRGADLRGADLQEADLQEADLEGADVRSLKSALRTKNASKADFTFAQNLTQDQLETMLGDTGLLLPAGLVYPRDWPEWVEDEESDEELEGTPEQDENSVAARAALVQRIEADSPVAAVFKDGKIDVSDMPPDGKPAADDPQDLAARFEALLHICQTFMARWDADTPNISQAIKEVVSQCLKSAQERDLNWYIWINHVSEIEDRLDLDADYDWRGTDRIARRIRSQVLELKQYLKPLPVDPSASGDDAQAPQIKIDESTPEKIEELSEILDRTLQIPEVKANFSERTIDLGIKVLAGLQEGLTRADSIDPRRQDTAPGIWQSNIQKLAGFVLSLLKLVSTNAVVNILSDALVDVLKVLRDALLLLFP